MNHAQFRELVAHRPVLLDGGTGTHLQAAGMPAGAAPEVWIQTNPTVLTDLQTRYMAAGSQIICSPTFGANRVKISRHQPDAHVEDVNRRLAEISVEARDSFIKKHPDANVFIAGDIGPTGRFLFPAGDMSLAELIDIYREQVRGLLAGRVDLFILETMIDLAEIRAAVLAIQAECDLPIIASLTYEENGHTLSGNSPLESLLTLAALGVDACGVNCSFGPDKLGELIEPIRSLSPIPLVLKPNAGLPILADGKTIFPMDPDTFVKTIMPSACLPLQLLGGCCGTGPDHIAGLREALASVSYPVDYHWPHLPRMICSARQSWMADDLSGVPAVDCQSADSIADDVLDALDDDPPAVILDLESLQAPELWPDVIEALQQLQVMVRVPLIFQTSDAAFLEELLLHYSGRAGVIGPLPSRTFGAVRLD